MIEGKHIHFSPTDNKPLCSYSGKLCRQRRLNGYAFCIRHILEDKSAPFKQCSYVTRNNSQKCLNAIPSNQDRGYCHSHMQVVGIIPKTERKSKALNSASKADSSSSISSNGSDKSTSPTAKKDPGAVFKFEEDSSDITDVFSYKNGLINNATLNGKNKGSKSKGKDSNGSSAKNGKPTNGFNYSTANFTTKRVTDKNKNVYTAIIPTGNSVASNGSSKAKSKNGSWNGSLDSFPGLPTQQRSSSYVVHLGSGFRTQKFDNDNLRRGEKELNKPQDVDEVRLFEHLKTLKQLDRSSIGGSSISSDDENSCDAKFKIFPRLAAAAATALPKEFSTTIIPENVISSTVTLSTSQSPKENSSLSQSSEKRCKSEIVFTPPVPPLITRSNNGIIIKTEPKREVAVPENDRKNDGDSSSERIDQSPVEKQRSSSGILSKANENSKEDSCSSIGSRDTNYRHEFLAHVRNTFKSQYTSIKKACKVSETYEEERKQKFRDSLVRCVRIDSSICAQVLVGNGSKFSVPTKVEEVSKDFFKTEVDAEYDDYEFFDNDILSSSSVNKACTAIVDFNSKSRKFYSNGKKSSSGESKIKVEESNKKGEKGKSSAKKSKPTGKKGSAAANTAEFVDEDALNGTAMHKNTAKSAKRIVTEDAKIVLRTPPSKRRLKRADAIVGTGSVDSSPSSMSSLTDSIRDSSVENIGLSSADKVVKRRRFSSSEMSGVASELGLTLNSQHSPAFELGEHANSSSSTEVGLTVKCEKMDERGRDSNRHTTLNNPNNSLNDVHHELHDMLGHSSSMSAHRNQGLETVLISVGSSENAGTPDGVITDASFDSTFEHSTSSQPDCEFSEDDLEHSFELQIDPEIESQASRLLEDNVLTEADFTELFPDNRMSDHKFGRNDLQELGMAALDFDVNDIDYSLFANIFPNFPRTTQPESISISNPF